MSENGFFSSELSRRDAMKTALKAGAYAAPIILTAAVPAVGVAAATPPPPPLVITASAVQSNATATSLTFNVTFTIQNGNKNATNGLSIRPSNSTAPAGNFMRIGNYNTDANGNGSLTAAVVYTPTSGGTAVSADFISGPLDSTNTYIQPIPYRFTLTTSGGGLQGVVVTFTGSETNAGFAAISG